MNKIARKLISCILLVCIFALFSFQSVSAVSGLTDARDLIGVTALGARTQHAITFGLPIGGVPVVSTDYIFIDMEKFTEIEEPTYLSGPFTGEPSYSISGKVISIRGIGLKPGETITILGIRANNPTGSEEDMYISVSICGDSACSDPKYQQAIEVMKASNKVTVQAYKSGDVGSLRISGYASPGMFISFFEGGNANGTTTASESGYFSQNFFGLPPVAHTFTIYGLDPGGRVTPPVIIQDIFTPALTHVVVEGILVPPTISIDKEEIEPGQTLNIAGSGAPNHQAIIFTEPPLKTLESRTASVGGEYVYAFSDTSDLEYGDHKIYAILQDEDGVQSHQSIMLFFRVGSGTVPPDDPGEVGVCDIFKGNLNCDVDSVVDLTDFSILLYYWGTSSPAADINKDGSVNLVDFSIMMFYWNG